jgi:2,5-diketo-D-gluconate reductase B
MPPIPLTKQGIPLLGLGTYPLRGDDCRAAILMGLEEGYRHVDTAQMYGNERETGEALAASGMPRDDLFVVTKMDPGNVSARHFMASLRQSLDALKLEFVDLLLIHWPPKEDFDGAIDRLNEALDQGLAKRIGVSNFTIAQMRRAQELSEGRLVNNQVEFHPLLDQSRVKQEAEILGMCLSAYSPLGRGLVLKDETILDIAASHGRAPSEVVLRWIIQQGVVAIPMSTKRHNARSNLKALEFALSPDDMFRITARTAENRRLIVGGSWAPQWD